MKRLLVMVTIVALLGVPMTVCADPDAHYQHFKPARSKADVSLSTDTAGKEAVLTSGTEADSAAKKDNAEKPRESVPSVSEMYAF